ncbi:MAG: spermidine synthase [Acidimicrobiales bacterium]
MQRLGSRPRLVLLSALMLLVELALIRWVGSNVLYLSYFSNFVLLGSFLGIGLGFLRAHAKVDLFKWAPLGLATLVAFIALFPVKIDRTGSNLVFFGEVTKTGLPPWVTLPVIFLAVAAALMMITQGVARTFAEFEPLEAYRLDICGSILGIVVFSVLSFLRAPPIAWGLVAGAIFVILGIDFKSMVGAIQGLAIVGFVGLLAVESLSAGDSWSPYYKITTVPDADGTHRVDVNGIPHQAISSTEQRRADEPLYFLPYERSASNRLDDVLIVGAGNGTDVAIALQNNAQHVDAVEIDPRLYELGKELQPNRPYQDARVKPHIDDGRAFLNSTDRQYDTILFALPDSLTLVSGQSQLRLESFLFTKQALIEARDHLEPGGVFAMYNYYRERWLVDRLANTLQEVYGHAPCLDLSNNGHFALMTIGVEPAATTCGATWVAETASVPPPASDDYPFLYLRTRGIPSIYLLALGLILLASVAAVRVASGPLSAMRPYVDLFCMGAAFLLLETKSVVQFALLFGTTWFVNALVFTGILLSVLAAIEVTRRIPRGFTKLLYVALGVSLAVAYLLPLQRLLVLPIVPRFAVATVVSFAPIFVANLIFADRFRDTGSSTVAFGANLLGAILGGVLEYASLLVGYRSLLIGVALLYGLAFVTRPRKGAMAPVAGASSG